MFVIRPEKDDDKAGIRHVNEKAFNRRNEADLVDALRDSEAFIISLVAVHDDQIVGHILFSLVRIEAETGTTDGLGLGPMAVLPAYQNQGIGSMLIKKGLELCQDSGFNIVVVLGHPTYYPRFGFVPSKPLGIQWEHDVPEELFMVVTLADTGLASVTGIVKYHPAFNGV
ncbi:MAG: N-acetyltransferase [Anaerolineae bacterium]|nr:N-acetyltransferase [Anaerolineae bacterium]